MPSALPVLFLVLGACASVIGDDSSGGLELPACVIEHPIGGTEDDLAVDLGVGADGVVAECESDSGEGCPVDEWNVGRAGALCLAEGRGYQPAVHEVGAYLFYDGQVDRPCWAVTWTWDTDDMSFGVLLVVDVLEGGIVDEDAWSKPHDEEPC